MYYVHVYMYPNSPIFSILLMIKFPSLTQTDVVEIREDPGSDQSGLNK